MFRLFALAALVAATAAGPARAEIIVGLTTNPNQVSGLVTFDSGTPGTATPVVAITGASGTFVAIDRRPADGLLYGLTSGGGLYTLDTTTGAATLVSNLTVGGNPLSGTVGGFDFNPVANALRIITTAGANYRLTAANFGTGVLTTDTPISGAGSIYGSAYTNNVSGAATTALYGIDSNNNLVSTSNPNGGAYISVGSLGVGVFTTSTSGFDISGVTQTAYATLTPDAATSGTSYLYTVNLTTGAATQVGPIGQRLTILDIAAPVGTPTPVTATPVPATLPLVLLGAATTGLVGRLRRRVG